MKNVNYIVLMILLSFLFSFDVYSKTDDQPLCINIEDAVQIGVSNHYALKLYQHKDAAFNMMITEYWREYLPTLGLSYQRQNQVMKGATDSRQQEIRIQLEQMIYDGGQRGLNLDVAKLQRLLNEDEFKITYNQLKFNIQQFYLQALAAKGIVRLTDKSLSRAILQLEQTKRENDLGFSTKLQVMSVASKVEEIRLSLSKSKSDYLQKIDQLKIALNISSSTPIELKGNIYYDFVIEYPKDSIDDLISFAIRNRSELIKSTTNLMMKGKQLQIAENYWIPKLYIGSYYTRSGEDTPLSNKSWGLNLRFSFPLGGNTTSTTMETGKSTSNSQSEQSMQSNVQVMDSMSTSRAILEGQTSLAEAENDHSKLKESIIVEVTQAYNSILQAREAISIGCNRTYYQYQSLMLMSSKHDVGQVARSEIVAAEMDLVEAQENLTEAIASYLIYSYQLESSVGISINTLKLFQFVENGKVSIFKQMLGSGRVEHKNNDSNKVPQNIDNEVLPDNFLLDDIRLDDSRE